MKLKYWLKYIEPITIVEIWTPDDDEYSGPSFQGAIMDIPWYLTEYYIERPHPQESVYLSLKKTSFSDTSVPVMVINVKASLK